MEKLYKKIYQSPLGPLSLLADTKSLRGIYFENYTFKEGEIISQAIQGEIESLREASLWLDAYFSGKKPRIEYLNLDPLFQTDFRKKVWEILLQIPYGQTLTYGQIARKIIEREKDKKMSAQAVGGAVGSNSISIIIPCHRVIGSDGSLTGYGGGLEKKRFLLNLEGIDYLE